MFEKFTKASQLIKNMGWKYVFFRLSFELKKRTRILHRSFPTNPEIKSYYTLDKWKKNHIPFFFESKNDVELNPELSTELETNYQNISSKKFPFFSGIEFNLGANYDWLTNPDTGYRYNKNTHWININDYSELAGDIKFVWEPSRFSHLYTLIRYDKHSGNDCSEQVFKEIEDWINGNAINLGPNFKCSQEISLRVMNWIFTLHYYRNSINLTEDRFNKIQHYIYWQIQHVYNNINFSRIAVRNNHAITETLALYITGLLFPDFPDAAKWKNHGKHWFEEEIAYQIYEDGTFLQFSMNYHRVVIQLLTWAIQLAHANNEKFESVVYDRAEKSLIFLKTAMDKGSGWLPNYGANDGALFFKLNDNHYRDFRPQLEALSCALSLGWEGESFEDVKWYGLKNNQKTQHPIEKGYSVFDKGGYYIFRSTEALSFIRCGNHQDRPSQADNLHLDIWHKGLNVLHDAGSYKYNSSPDDLKYFMGTRSHNTVMLDDFDQMKKGARFIWYNWTQCESVIVNETEDVFYFKGTITAFQYVNKAIRHTRYITINKKKGIWEITDTITEKPDNLVINQIWHTCFPDIISFKSVTDDGHQLMPTFSDGYYSSYYGQKEKCTQITFLTKKNTIKTIIVIN